MSAVACPHLAEMVPAKLARCPEEAAFLRAICLHPADLTPRLVYADWLDDRGDHQRAGWLRTPELPPDNPQRDQLLAAVRDAVAGCVPKRNRVMYIAARSPGEASPSAIMRYDGDSWHTNRLHLGVGFGCVESVGCSEGQWRRYGPDLVATQPIQGVRFKLLTVVAFPPPWHRALLRCGTDSADALPRWLFDHLPPAVENRRLHGQRFSFYRDQQEALDAASVAAVRWARRAAGLPVPADPALAF